MLPLNETTLFFGVGVGFALWAGWVGLILLGVLWVYVWKWIDDADEKKPHPLLRLFKFERVGRSYEHKIRRKGSKKSLDIFDVVMGTCVLGVLIIPALGAITIVLIHFYAIPLIIAVLVICAFMTRFGRRHKKLFDKHVGNPKAHEDANNES